MAYSMDHLGVFGGTLSDMWTTARTIASRAGGDPSHPGLYGEIAPPAPRKPARLIRLDTAGWPAAEPGAKAQFEAYLSRLVDAGVEIVTRRDDPAIEAYEIAHTGTPQLWTNLYRFEMHWPMLQYRERYSDKMPPRLLKGIEDGAHITQETYRAALTDAINSAPCTMNWRSAPMVSSRCRRRSRADRHGPGQRDLQRGVVRPRRASHQSAVAGGRSCAAWRAINGPLA